MAANLSSASSNTSVSLPVESSSARNSLPPLSHPLEGNYKIEDRRQSEHACLLFARHKKTNESIVIKILIEYKDARYSLATIDERQQCQLEALRWNRTFTPKVYIGLAHICDLDLHQGKMAIDEIIENPVQDMLDADTEYVLLMRQLPDSRRLDHVLIEEDNSSLQPYLRLLTKFIVHLHTNLAESILSLEESRYWGSTELLQQKLLHNLAFLHQLLETGGNEEYKSFSWLKDNLLQVFLRLQRQGCFEQRVRERRIKRCHADLKAPNIWIAPCIPDSYWCNKEPEKYVFLLDAIDFNPMYSNIDILSDFAMLVIDVHARTKNLSFVNFMIENYLRLSEQQDEVCKLVLTYYLIEKAIVGAAVSILYDSMPDLGLAFLEVAEIHMNDLKHRISNE